MNTLPRKSTARPCRLVWVVSAALVPAALAAIGNAPGNVAGYVKGFRGEVRVFQSVRAPDGRVETHDWVKVEREGHEFEIQDVIRTGPDGRALLEMADRIEDPEAAHGPGPSVFHIEPNTQMAIASFDVDYDRAKRLRRPRGVFELIHGTIRNFIKGWGQSSYFSIRAGVAVCGIRGTDVTIEYVPEGEVMTVTVHEGEVVVAGPYGSKLVHAGESVRFVDGRPPGVPPA